MSNDKDLLDADHYVAIPDLDLDGPMDPTCPVCPDWGSIHLDEDYECEYCEYCGTLWDSLGMFGKSICSICNGFCSRFDNRYPDIVCVQCSLSLPEHALSLANG